MTDTHLALLTDRFMRRIHMALQAKAHEFDTEKVGPGGGMVLLSLADLEPAPLNELTRHVSRDKSQMTRLMGALEQKGLIARAASDQDARVSIVSLTPRGHAVVGTLREVLAETINEILQPLSGAEKDVFRDLMQRALDPKVSERR